MIHLFCELELGSLGEVERVNHEFSGHVTSRKWLLYKPYGCFEDLSSVHICGNELNLVKLIAFASKGLPK